MKGWVDDFIAYDINNSDANAVLKANHFSGYKGSFVFKTNIIKRSGSFGFLLISNEKENNPYPVTSETIEHEKGHTIDFDEVGPVKYAMFFALPSLLKMGMQDDNDYYRNPWELLADLHMGIRRDWVGVTDEDIETAWAYLAAVKDLNYENLLYIWKRIKRQ